MNEVEEGRVSDEQREYGFQFGSLWLNLLSLDLLLRMCLMQKRRGYTSLSKLEGLTQGDRVNKDEIINNSSFGRVINEFNEEFQGVGISIDYDRLNQLRNALAHGKVFSKPPRFFPMKIHNFGMIRNEADHVMVEYVAQMDIDWLVSNKVAVAEEMKKVVALYQSLMNGSTQTET